MKKYRTYAHKVPIKSQGLSNRKAWVIKSSSVISKRSTRSFPDLQNDSELCKSLPCICPLSSRLERLWLLTGSFRSWDSINALAGASGIEFLWSSCNRPHTHDDEIQISPAAANLIRSLYYGILYNPPLKLCFWVTAMHMHVMHVMCRHLPLFLSVSVDIVGVSSWFMILGDIQHKECGVNDLGRHGLTLPKSAQTRREMLSDLTQGSSEVTSLVLYIAVGLPGGSVPSVLIRSRTIEHEWSLQRLAGLDQLCQQAWRVSVVIMTNCIQALVVWSSVSSPGPFNRHSISQSSE